MFPLHFFFKTAGLPLNRCSPAFLVGYTSIALALSFHISLTLKAKRQYLFIDCEIMEKTVIYHKTHEMEVSLSER